MNNTGHEGFRDNHEAEFTDVYLQSGDHCGSTATALLRSRLSPRPSPWYLILLSNPLLLALLMLLSSCSQANSLPTRTPTPTPRAVATMAPTPTPFIEPSQTPTPKPPPLGPVPQDCPPGPTPRPIFAGIGPGIGSFPVWAFGFDGPQAVLRISPNDTYTQYGWTWKIVWEVGPNYTHPVTLQSGKLSGGAPLWFQFEAPTRSPVLDPQHPNHPRSVVGSDWAEWGSYLFIPTAGCYYLEADWPGGHWRITFAAGRE